MQFESSRCRSLAAIRYVAIANHYFIKGIIKMKTIITMVLIVFLACYIATAKDKLDSQTSGSVVSTHAATQGDSNILNNASAAIDSIIFNPNLTYGTVTDTEGNVYKTITIGNRVWMAENLKTTHYNDGTRISKVTDAAEWKTLTTPAYCWYNNDSVTNKATYGALYNWYVVNTGKLCPKGWHVPNDTDWTALTTYLDGASIAKSLQEIGTTHWLYSGGNNSSGFTAIGSGSRDYGNFDFLYFRQGAFWWCSNMSSTSNAWSRDILDSFDKMDRYTKPKVAGFSVRCVMNTAADSVNVVQKKDTIVFNPNLTYGTVTDKEGNVYKTIAIGTQVWMAENLRTTHYNDGTPIFYETEDSKWKYKNSEAYCWYNDDSAAYNPTYGALYNWYAVNTGKLCPPGWHVPSDSEWSTLTNYLGGESIAGGKLKEIDTKHWLTPNTAADDSSGFAALPGGSCSVDGAFIEAGNTCYLWSSSEHNSTQAWGRNMYSGQSYVYRYAEYAKNSGFSVRCVSNIAVSVKETLSKELPEAFVLFQNYPNPFNPTTSISFTLPSKSFISLEVFDLLGREVATLVNEQKPAGTYTQKWNAANVSSGIYFYRLQAGNYIQTKKLLVLK
jgi:uncharacterized protein (TIGR02145 family)